MGRGTGGLRRRRQAADARPQARRFDVERSPRYRLAALSRLWTESTEKLYQEEFGLLLSEWRILGLVAFHAPISAAQIAELGFLKKPHISRLVAGLTERGLIGCAPCDVDARRTWLDLTPAGEALFERIAERSLQRDALFCEGLAEHELVALDGLLDKLLAHTRAVLRRPD